MELDDYQKDNLANWNDRARVHAESKRYDLARYGNDPDYIGELRYQVPQMFSLWAERR